MQDVRRLAHDITSGRRAAHAFLIDGGGREERSRFARELAMGLECTSLPESSRPCGRCPSCRQVIGGTSMDVVMMRKSPGSGRTARETYKADDAAEFARELNMGAYGRFRIGLIEDADTMSETVQNKLLKTIEEPGPDTMILLTASNRDNLLSTIRSRCSDIHLEDTEDAEETGRAEAFLPICGMIEDRGSMFHEYRTLIDKNIKTREDALSFLDILKEDLRLMMTGARDSSMSPEEAAYLIEMASLTEMDIRREMSCAKALRRLFLETR